jgi:hypothetical protein
MSGSLATRKAMYEAEGKIATNLAKQQKAASDALNKRQKEELEALNGDVVQAALFERFSSDPKVAEQAQAVISEALNQVFALSDAGVVGASDKARVLAGFIKEMEADKLAEVPDIRTGETVLTAERAVLDMDTADEVYKYLTERKAGGFIDRTDASAILSYWSNNVKAVPEAKLHIMDPQSPARQTQDSMISSLGLTNELGEMTSTNRIIEDRARREFDMMYREQLAAAKKQLGVDRVDYTKQLDIAEYVRGRLIPKYQDIALANLAEEALQLIEQNRLDDAAITAATVATTGDPIVDDAAIVSTIKGGSN